jgi:hypothetical protein
MPEVNDNRSPVALERRGVSVDQRMFSASAIVDQKPGTSTWFTIRLTPTTFAIFDTFPDDSGRAAHLSGKVAAVLMAQAPDMLAHPPVIEKIDVLAVKIPTAIANE